MSAVISKLSGIGEEIPDVVLDGIDGGVFLLPWRFYIDLTPIVRLLA